MNDPLAAFRLDGKVVVLTGASAGLGVRFAHALAAAGARLAVGARRTDQLVETARKLTAAGADIVIRTTDVTDPDSCRALVGCALDRFGRVDVLVNNAGLGAAITALKEPPDHFRSIVDANLMGSYWMAQECGRVMAPGSVVVNVSSVHGLAASRFPQAAYAASKAAVLGLTRDLAQQWSGRRGIRVNALAPGYFDSEMTAAGRQALESMVCETSMLGRFGRPGELDGALLFLASPASSYMTGATLVVDGGMSASI